MDAAQMLRHCSRVMDLCLGRIAIHGRPRLLSRLIVPLFLRSFLTKRHRRHPAQLRHHTGHQGPGRYGAARHVRGDKGGGRQSVGSPPHAAPLSPVPAGLNWRAVSSGSWAQRTNRLRRPNPARCNLARPIWGPRRPLGRLSLQEAMLGRCASRLGWRWR